MENAPHESNTDQASGSSSLERLVADLYEASIQAEQAEQDQMSKYQHLAREARWAGNGDLADRLDRFADEICAQLSHNCKEREADNALRLVQELSRPNEHGTVEVFWDLDTVELEQAVLPRIRRMLLGQANMNNLQPQVSEDGSSVYTVELTGDMCYVETHYSPTSEWPGIIKAEVSKPPSAESRDI